MMFQFPRIGKIKAGDQMTKATQELASRWQRLWGALLDGLIAMAIVFPVMWISGVWQPLMQGEQISVEQRIWLFIFGVILFFVLQGYLLAKHGQTIGKRIVGTRIVSAEDGQIFPLSRIFWLRLLPVSLIGQIPTFGQWLSIIDVLFIFRKDKRCIHDLIAGTKVVKANASSVEGRSVTATEDAFYDEVAKELETNKLIPGVWTRAFAEADGDENCAKAIYIKLRVAQMAGSASHRKTSIQEKSTKGGLGKWVLAVVVLVVVLAVIGIIEYRMIIQSRDGSPSRSSPVTLYQQAKNVFEPAYSKAASPQAGRVWAVDLGSGVSMEFMPVAAGSFVMGSENGQPDEKPVRRVALSKSYWLAKTEVTQAQYQQVTGGNPSNFRGLQNPVEMVSWNDAIEFCRKLTEQERQAGRLPEGYAYTLPTEAQWEYACRAGTSGDYAGSLDSMGWYNKNSGSTTHPVGQKQPNAWGLYDMHGNVWEWCSDWYSDSYENNPSGSVTDRHGASSGSHRALRGGSWNSFASLCRSAIRDGDSPESTLSVLGFRPLVQQK